MDREKIWATHDHNFGGILNLVAYLSGWWCLEHFLFFHISGGIIIPTDFHMFQRGRYTTNQLEHLVLMRIETSIGRKWLVDLVEQPRTAQIGPAKWPWNTCALGRARCHWPFQYSADSRYAWMVPGWLTEWRRSLQQFRNPIGKNCGLHLVITRSFFFHIWVCLKLLCWVQFRWIMTVPIKMVTWTVYTSFRQMHLQTESSG